MENDIIIDIEKKLISSKGIINLKINVSLQFNELIVLFGESGSGKTTLLRILSGLLNPDKGSIVVGGKIWFDSILKINLTPQKRNIGFMFQDYALFPNMTVLENILYAQKEKDKKNASEILEKFEIAEFSNLKTTKLSGGQKQRVALARAIARKPDILLLDEPLSALDAKTRLNLQDEILKAHQLNITTTLLVSHDIAEVFKLAQKVIKIGEGKVVSFGKPEDLFLDDRVSGKVQFTGTLVRIEKMDTFYLLTIIVGLNQIVKVSAFQDDMVNLKEGDSVFVFTKAFNPIILKI